MPITRFIEQSNQVTCMDTLVQAFCETIKQFGYTSYCCFSMDGLYPDTNAIVSVNGEKHYNEDFLTRYQEGNYLEIDPVYKLFWHARGPFTWEQVHQLPLNKRQREIMEVRFDAGYKTGIGMSIQSYDPKIVGMCVKSNTMARMDRDAVAQLYAACNQFHFQRATLLSKQHPLNLPDVSLSPREKEILCWCAQGKSNGVIASILGISERTVEFHFKSVFDKLHTANRITAVLKAMHLKLIHIDPVQLKAPKEMLN